MSDEDAFTSTGQDPLVGTVIADRYRVEKKLGQGGMGAVYLAEHMLIKKKVAIKCLHAGLASNSDVVRRFHNEAVAATAIGHPHIVDVTDMGRFDDGTFFMALEYLSGRDWQDDLDATGAQPLEKVAHIGMQICDALDAATAKGIVHRDLKPENIFLIERHGDPNFVKVLDFGISKFHDGIGGSTRTGELMGTPYYMAPEQVRGERNVTHVADIYALGVIFHQALTGKVPFDGNTLPELILKIAQDPAPNLTERLDNIPVAISDLVHGMLEKDPNHRPQRFSDVANVLANFVGESSRLSRGGSMNDAFTATTVGGSANVTGSGEPVPERTKQPTPVANRGPDTNAGGTPGMFGHTELPKLRDAHMPGNAPAPEDARTAKSAGEHGTTTSPHSITNSSTAAPKRPTSASSKAPWIATAAVLLVGGGWFAAQEREVKNADTEVANQPAASNENVVRVQISTVPPDAELFLDGEPISNPFDGELAKDKKSHELITKREGFLDDKRKLVLTSAQRVFVQMQAKGNDKPLVEEKPTAAVLPGLRPSKPPPPRAPGPAPAPAAVEPPTPAPAPAPAPAPTPAPTELKKIF